MYHSGHNANSSTAIERLSFEDFEIDHKSVILVMEEKDMQSNPMLCSLISEFLVDPVRSRLRDNNVLCECAQAVEKSWLYQDLQYRMLVMVKRALPFEQ